MPSQRPACVTGSLSRTFFINNAYRCHASSPAKLIATEFGNSRLPSRWHMLVFDRSQSCQLAIQHTSDRNVSLVCVRRTINDEWINWKELRKRQFVIWNLKFAFQSEWCYFQESSEGDCCFHIHSMGFHTHIMQKFKQFRIKFGQFASVTFFWGKIGFGRQAICNPLQSSAIHDLRGTRGI